MKVKEAEDIIELPETQAELELQLARLDFYNFCKLMMPKFYKDERDYLYELCEKLQDFIEKSDKHYLIINLPPRHGKSLTL